MLNAAAPTSWCPTLVFRHSFSNESTNPCIYILSLHDALPISRIRSAATNHARLTRIVNGSSLVAPVALDSRRTLPRSEEHTSELQSRLHLVCRLLLEKKKSTLEGQVPVLHK